MTIEVKEKLYTVEEFLNLNLPDDAELIEGQIVAKQNPGPSAEHGDIITRLTFHLDGYAGVNAGQTRLGKFYSGSACTLGQPNGTNYVRPDLCFVLDGRTPEKFKGPIPVAPDLAIEVNSPTDDNESMQNKVDAYLQAGVRLIWSIYMVQKFVAVYRLNAPNIKFLNLNDELDGEDVIPGFKLKVNKLFE